MNLILIGAGKGGAKVLHTLADYREVSIACVVDIDGSAPGIAVAKEKGIPVANDIDAALQVVRSQIDVILEVTGDTAVYMSLLRRFPVEPIVVPASALKFFLLLMGEKERLIGAARTRQRDLQRILDATHDGMIGIDLGTRVTFCNAAASRLLGTPEHEIRGRKSTNWIPDETVRPVLSGHDGRVLQMTSDTGTDLVVHCLPIDDENGSRIGAMVVLRDVTEVRRLAEEVTNLRELQQWLEAVIQSTQDAISVVDKNGMGLLINPAYTRLTGLSPEEVIGHPAEVDIAEGESMHLQVLRTGKPVKSVPLKVGLQRREVIVDVAPIWVEGELRGAVGVIHDISEIARLNAELNKANRLLRSLSARYSFADIVGGSQSMVVAIEQAKRAAATPATVLLRGESGTGKELFAHAIHQESDRAGKPFLRVNCASLGEGLLEVELFGQEPSTWEMSAQKRVGLMEDASGGTLFLDEIGELSLATQAKLLRAIQEREIVRVGGSRPVPVDVRFICATHVNLEQAVARGTFREDLYYRLNVIPIFIPPLRYRKEDLAQLAIAIVSRHNQTYGRNVTEVDPDAIAALSRWDWPGNVRELENVLGRAMMAVGYAETKLRAHHLPPLGFPNLEQTTTAEALPSMLPLHGTLADRMKSIEKLLIQQTLSETGGNKTETARRLGISVRSLYYKMGSDGP
ncbi:MAG: sigma 54-interacting transcriptional regulator [Alicyclobacillaceae bacterium]|jgi:PAS domain S-box-containing protein|uniref:sigma 54-interacting transcriptional regulator n=1 Tax=Alicyclobacillus sp. SP_1 TaxID=2942475 RepID=UPI0021583406|nr:sigma 54-interacting transcriptional regulator [Alicyclobacillus sp. SP_1]MCY0888980.1 sigma 54-interacting transcriptional regulator [Alicyclobacillaceae bacterium]